MATTGLLPVVRRAFQQRRGLRVLALGPFPSGGYGSAPGSAKYGVRLKAELQRVLPGLPLEVEARRLPGQTTAEAPETIANTVMEVRPDLVVWSAGTHDALARADIEPFVAVVGYTLAWLKSHSMDAIIVEPPYAAAVAQDEHYTALIKSLREVAHRHRVPVVLRYDAMRYLAGKQVASAEPHFWLHDTGRRCGPEYVARAVARSLQEPTRGTSP